MRSIRILFLHGLKVAGFWLLLFSAAHAGSLAVGRMAPDVSLALAKGGQISLSQLRGQIVLLNFWSSWCGPCREEFPVLDTLYRAHHEHGLVLIGVDIDAYPEDAVPFLKKHPVAFPIAGDAAGAVSSRFSLDSMPMSVLIDRRGTIRWIHRGFNADDDREYAAQVDALLRET
jgi:peroxiredoxin